MTDRLPSYRMVEDIPAPEGVVTPEGDRLVMVDLASAALRESALKERIRELEKHNDLLDTRVGYWFMQFKEANEHCTKTGKERINRLKKYNDLLQTRVDYWYKRSQEVEERCRELEAEGALPKEENQNLKSMVQSLDKANLELGDANEYLKEENEKLKQVQEDLIKRALERILNETT